MEQIALPLTKMQVSTRSSIGEHQVYEGETKMNPQQQDAYQALIGNGLAKVQVGRDMAEKDFGNGGGVFVNVTLTCDQSQGAINQAVQLAHQLAEGAVVHYHGLLRQDLVNRGMIKP